MVILEILGTIAFSISGAVEAMKKEMDILGVLVLGLVTAVGGGVLRDVLMGQLPPAVFQNSRNVWIAIGAAFLAFIAGALLSGTKKELHVKLWNHVLLVSDAIHFSETCVCNRIYCRCRNLSVVGKNRLS